MNSICQVAPTCGNITDIMAWTGVKEIDQKAPLG